MIRFATQTHKKIQPYVTSPSEQLILHNMQHFILPCACFTFRSLVYFTHYIQCVCAYCCFTAKTAAFFTPQTKIRNLSWSIFKLPFNNHRPKRRTHSQQQNSPLSFLFSCWNVFSESATEVGRKLVIKSVKDRLWCCPAPQCNAVNHLLDLNEQTSCFDQMWIDRGP